MINKAFMINRAVLVATTVLALGVAAGCSGPTAVRSAAAPATASGSGVAQPEPVRTVSVPVPAAATRAAPLAAHAEIAATGATSVPRIPTYSHIVVVMLENHAYSEIVGSARAPFLNSLIAHGASLTRSYAVTHPSQPNYVALFSGSMHGLVTDACPQRFTGANLADSLRSHGRTFVGYSESLPAAGSTACVAGSYARKHSPWVNFAALPASVNQPMSAFPKDLTTLPTVSFVIPNLLHDMHDGTIAQSDSWLKTNLGAYATWAKTHNSLLLVTADEDDRSAGNHIATILSGAHVRAGQYSGRVTHYGVLRSLLDSYRIAPYSNAKTAAPITGMWTS